MAVVNPSPGGKETARRVRRPSRSTSRRRRRRAGFALWTTRSKVVAGLAFELQHERIALGRARPGRAVPRRPGPGVRSRSSGSTSMPPSKDTTAVTGRSRDADHGRAIGLALPGAQGQARIEESRRPAAPLRAVWLRDASRPTAQLARRGESGPPRAASPPRGPTAAEGRGRGGHGREGRRARSPEGPPASGVTSMEVAKNCWGTAVSSGR